MYKIIAFDLDDTLSPAKSPADKEMIDLLSKLLQKYKVAIITWGKFETINMQIMSHFEDHDLFDNLYIFPTIWTRMYAYKNKAWDIIYKQDLSLEQVGYIKEVLEDAILELKLKPKNIWWEMIENRGSQVTYSALWQQAPLEAKQNYDKDKKIRAKIVEYIKDDLKDFSIWIWGTTSIDITKKWMDKSFWMQKMMKEFGFEKKDILFIWDATFSWWNDYPVKKMWINTKQVSSPEDTKILIKELIS